MSMNLDSLKTSSKIEHIIEKITNLTDDFLIEHDPKHRKKLSQYFTPQNIAFFMASLFNLNENDQINIVDPCAGFGILPMAIINEIYKLDENSKGTAVLYELDGRLSSSLNSVFKNENVLKNWEIKVLNEDFLLSEIKQANMIICNPPYAKHSRKTYSEKYELNYEYYPNIYCYFLIKSLETLEAKGQLVFLLPRSFCSGSFYDTFRKTILDNNSIEYIHIFNSRINLFESVTQESIIVKIIKGQKQSDTITVSTSDNSFFENYKSFKIQEKDLIFSNSRKIIRIPSGTKDVQVIELADSWKKKFEQSEYCVSTGKVVDFRNQNSLTKEIIPFKNAPLIWMDGFESDRISFNTEKEFSAIDINEKTIKKLIPAANYVFIKRMTSKNQKKRIQSAYILKEDINSNYVGVDNKVNYIYKKIGEMTHEETIGLSAFLNISFIDNYFRVINGNTQVNVSDIKILPFIDRNIIVQIGNYVIENGYSESQIIELLQNNGYNTIV